MLVFLLKNGRLRLPVFLLVLVIGTELLPSAAPLQCYHCDGEECKTNFTTTIKLCEPENPGGPEKTSCFAHVRATSATRSCEYAAFSKICAEKLYKRSCQTTKEMLNDDFRKCLTEKASGGSARSNDMNQASDSEEGFCYCDTDLCNTGQEVVKVNVGGGNPSPPNPTGPGGDPPAPTDDDKKTDNGTATGGPYSSFNTFGVLFFAVLGAFVSAGSVMVRS